MHEDAGRRLLAVPFHGFRDQFAVSVFLGDVGDNKGRQSAFDGQRLTAVRDSAFGLQILDEDFQFRFRFALHAEGAGNVAFGDSGGRSLAIGRGRAANVGDHLLARRQRGGSRLHGAMSGACRAPTYFLILQRFHFSRAAKADPTCNVSSMVQGNKRLAPFGPPHRR